tara:strand:- start:838 stop:990 length:153 start_codon:yes stop_codon:yes gene_type:complete
VANVESALVEKILNVVQVKWETDVHYYGQPDNFRRCFKIMEWILNFIKKF